MERGPRHQQVFRLLAHLAGTCCPKIQALTYAGLGAGSTIFMTHHLFWVIIFPASRGIWQNRQKPDLGRRITEQPSALLSARPFPPQNPGCVAWHGTNNSCDRIGASPLLRKELPYGTIGQSVCGDSLESQEADLQVCVYDQKPQ